MIHDYLSIRIAAPVNFSFDDRHLLVQSDLSGTMQVFSLDVESGALAQLTDEVEPVNGMYLPDRRAILLATDEGGNERLQLRLMDAQTRRVRPLVVDPAFIHRPGGISRDGRLLAYACNRRNGVEFDIYVRDVETGAERLVFGEQGWCEAAGFSPDGQWLAVQRQGERSGDNDLFLVDVEVDRPDAVHVSPHEDQAAFGPPAWLPDASAFFFATNTGRDIISIARYDMASASWTYVLETPWDAECIVDWAGDSLLVVTNEDGVSRAELRDPVSLSRRAEIPLPGRGVASNFTYSRDGRRLAFHFTSPIEPGDVWLYELDGGTLRRLTTSPNPVDASTFCEPTLHRCRSFDGEEIPLFLYQPLAGPFVDAPSPVVVLVHGGPESQSRPMFISLVQYLVGSGYAVAVPNVRGSTGYGKHFSHLDDRRLRLDSVRDLEAVHLWLDNHPALDARRATVLGSSYGGYMVLAALVWQPDLWAAGVDIVGISSLVTFLENTSVWRRASREREYGSLTEDRDFLVEASPLTHIDRLRAPLFLIHGANDPRVPVSEARQVHRVLEEKGIRSELLVYDDEGHGLSKLRNRLDAYPKAVEFLDEVLAQDLATFVTGTSTT
ncbi:MAG: S9 family peptidase [Candidatus Dormibacteraeota bacterium]|nr:S9 family peptidase [Candidatus Dormibacteraeota bacterium]